VIVARWTIPEPIAVDWEMRKLESARVDVSFLSNGRIRRTIEHAVIPGVTSEMMLWFLKTLPEQIEWRGSRFLCYRLWHPRDHIMFERFGVFEAGCKFHIVEAFAAKPEFLVDELFEVVKLDRSGFVMRARLAGQTMLEMDERFEDTPAGMKMTVQMTLGSEHRWLYPLNRLARVITGKPLEAWLTHNVEEDGNLSHVVPELYRKRS
jgi:hypothetical protein